jgi:hypothetical protein
MVEDPSPRTYRFSITVTVEPDDTGFDDPEWVADAAAGVLERLRLRVHLRRDRGRCAALRGS